MSQGSYTLTNLPIGPYRLEVDALRLPHLRADRNRPAGEQQSGDRRETADRRSRGDDYGRSDTPLVETRNPSIGAVIDNEAVEALPLEGRNVASLVVLAGGAVDTGNPSSRSLTQSRGIAVAGGQQFGVQYLLDGAMHNNWYDGVNLPLPFPDAMQEFRVETSSQNAQNGVKAGGTVSVATKAGTNLFHGDVFEFARHHRFNAKAPFAAINRATGERASDGLVRNQYGGVLGGPIVQDKIFFFGAYQGTRASQTPADIVTFIPTAGDAQRRLQRRVASAQCRAQGNLTLPAALGFVEQPDRSGAAQPGGGEDLRGCCRRRTIRAVRSRTRVRPSRARTSRSDASTGSSLRIIRCSPDTCCRPCSGSRRLRTRAETSSPRRSAAATTRSTRWPSATQWCLSNTMVNNIRVSVEPDQRGADTLGAFRPGRRRHQDVHLHP